MPRSRATHRRSIQHTAVRVGRQGRVVIPSELRSQLGLKAGDGLDATIEGGALILRPRSEVLAELQAMFKGVRGSLAKELSEERRKAAKELDP